MVSGLRIAIGSLAAVLLVALAAVPADAEVNRRAVEADFQRWVAGALRAEAKAAGIGDAIYAAAMDGVALDWSLPDLQPPGAAPPAVQHQAEFRSPARYFDEDQIKALVRIGRRKASQWEQTLAAVERRYGVPGAVLLAIWGRETAFGAAELRYDTIRTLATRAFIGRRKEAFRGELIAALRILQAGQVQPRQLRSSWAGALGQPQLLPSHFLRVAVDFDGDGRRDIWDSVPDTLATIANFLRESGWEAGRSWGVEASVPSGVPCTLEGPEQGIPLEAWARLGVTRVDGSPLASSGDRGTAFLLLPAGRLGPAFIVTPNFYLLKTYNNSDLYALFIGHVGDRLERDSGFSGRWRTDAGFSRNEVQAMQERLVARGYDVGGADGLVGYKTRIALGDWQIRNGHEPTCFPDAALIRSVR